MSTETSEGEHCSPALLAVAITFTVLLAGGVLALTVLTKGELYPTPYQSAAAARLYFAKHAMAVRVVAFLQFGAAIPLGIFAAAAVSRVRFFGVTVAGPEIALFGGIAAAIMAALSALLKWAITLPEIAALPSAHALHVLAFALGGPGHIVPLGLLVAGLSLSAGLSGLLPRWLMWFGLVIAALAELSSLCLLIPAAAYFMAAARVLGFVWLIATGARLPRAGVVPTRGTSRPVATELRAATQS
ncbi:MAG TPA: hypothetical protein VMU50_07860 [Polyangia bacterium]|nr:hypothetical protein [Polyangia bacterium]